MYKHKDPLNKLYVALIRESGHEDYRPTERDEAGHAVNLKKEPGLHVYDVEEVILKDGSMVPGEMEFTADWQGEDFETHENRRHRTHDAGFVITPTKLYIPAAVAQDELDSMSGKPGVFHPSMDLLPQVTPKEVEHLTDRITELFNDKSGWGQTNHYLPDPRDTE